MLVSECYSSFWGGGGVQLGSLLGGFDALVTSPCSNSPQARDIHSLVADIKVGWDCIAKATLADWWEWRGSSTTFFWHWHPSQQIRMRDGETPWFCSSPQQ
jgi:hypothetical protein